jgi:hypothetical protein
MTHHQHIKTLGQDLSQLELIRPFAREHCVGTDLEPVDEEDFVWSPKRHKGFALKLSHMDGDRRYINLSNMGFSR